MESEGVFSPHKKGHVGFHQSKNYTSVKKIVLPSGDPNGGTPNPPAPIRRNIVIAGLITACWLLLICSVFEQILNCVAQKLCTHNRTAANKNYLINISQRNHNLHTWGKYVLVTQINQTNACTRKLLVINSFYVKGKKKLNFPKLTESILWKKHQSA